MTSANWPRWERAIREVCALAEQRGLEPYREMTLEIGDPLPEAELESLQRIVGPLPADYLEVLGAARSVTFSYVCGSDEHAVGCIGPVEALWDDGYLLWCGQVAAEFGYFNPGEEGQWITPFVHLEDDDFLAFRMDGSDRDGEVFFAAHDDHESRLRIAASFTEFMERWTALCCPDFESLLQHFWDKEQGEIRCDGEAAKPWLTWIRG